MHFSVYCSTIYNGQDMEASLMSINRGMYKEDVADGMGREKGGGFRMGNTCIPVADSF